MKPIGEAAAVAARHRKFSWCRRHSGFCDMPIWRVVASRLNLPLFQVVALVNRLEEFANAAEQRGHVGDFNPAEFGAALGMPTEDAARIFAELEHPDIGWVAYDHVATFYGRNPDREEDAEAWRGRKRRQRAREKGMKEIARRFARGEIDQSQRRALEAELLIDARLSTGRTSHRNVTMSHRDTCDPVDNFRGSSEFSDLARHDSHIVTSRDIVTVTPEQSRILNQPELCGGSARGDSPGLPMGTPGSSAAELEVAVAWLEREGKQLLVDRIQIRTQLAEVYLERWRRDLQDDRLLAKIIQDADAVGYIGPRFHTIVTDQLRRHRTVGGQGSLPLSPVALQPSQRSKSA